MTDEQELPPEDDAGTNDAAANDGAGERSADSASDETIPLDAARTPEEELQEASLQEKLEATKLERDQNYDRWVRATAELETLRRRSRQELDEVRKYQAGPLANDLLPALDNLQRAVAAADSSNESGELVTGLKMVISQLHNALSNHSVTMIEAEGQPFDPNLHEALQQVPTPDHPPMTVIQQIETGYMIQDRVLRPSKVIVAAPPATG